MAGQSTVRIQTGLLPDSAVIWRLPGPGGLIYPVFHYIDEYHVSKFIFGALMGVGEDETTRFEDLMLRELVRINEGIV
uniref:Uncharacterized protein n=1 Tax=Panagrolaimus sp. JU765 TaxID=591449 RepID=A0AC34Q9P4_9BILA